MKENWSCAAVAAVLLAFLETASAQCPAGLGANVGPFTPKLESLAQHQAVPEWFRNAKLGMYAHWGVYSVPAFGNEWYPRWMYLKEFPDQPNTTRFYRHHVATYGDPSIFNYHDFVPMFRGEKFDAEEWAELFHQAGARFAGPVAEHHDGFAMWDSELTPWNAKDRGPQRDISGELEVAIRKRGMKFMASFHHERQLQRYKGMSVGAAKLPGDRRDFDASHFPWVEGTATTSDDPELRLMYGNMPEEQWLREQWLGKLFEYIDKYEPDLIWFDAWLERIPEATRNCFGAYYLNAASSRGVEVAITRKHEDLPDAWSIEDFEKGRLDRLTNAPWLTDDTISLGSWSWTTDLKIKPLKRVLHDFIDIVSKNGQLLLNVSPMADGSIPQDQRDVLLGLGSWLKRNGEAIYDTRPWVIYGEGPSKMSQSGHFTAAVDYQPSDLRFTTKGPDQLYVIAMGAPRGTLTVKSLSSELTLYPDEIESVELLGVGPISGWRRDGSGLHIPAARGAADQPATAWKIVRKAPAAMKRTGG